MSGCQRVLITGGRGYVGGRVVRALRAHGDFDVIVGSRRGGAVVAMDWRDAESLRRACAGVDTVLHFAAMNEIDAARDPAAALEANGVATVRLLEAAVSCGVRRFLYLSTAHVYGPLVGHIDESSPPRPRHPYATSHRAAEDVVLAAHALSRIDGLVLRLSNSFGAPVDPEVDRWSLLVNDLCRQVATRGVLVLKSPGLQRRDFVPLGDVVRAVVHVLGLDWRSFGEPILNVGGQWAPTIYEMTQLVARRCEAIFGIAPRIERLDPSPGDAPEALDYDIDRLLATGFSLGGDAAAEIDDTLRLCHDHFERRG